MTWGDYKGGPTWGQKSGSGDGSSGGSWAVVGGSVVHVPPPPTPTTHTLCCCLPRLPSPFPIFFQQNIARYISSSSIFLAVFFPFLISHSPICPRPTFTLSRYANIYTFLLFLFFFIFLFLIKLGPFFSLSSY